MGEWAIPQCVETTNLIPFISCLFLKVGDSYRRSGQQALLTHMNSLGATSIAAYEGGAQKVRVVNIGDLLLVSSNALP